VTGAIGSGLVLQNNGADNLQISGNGSFTFPSSLNGGSAYAVTVLTHPTLQNCTVSNGQGTAAADVTNVSVTCVDSVQVRTFAGTGASGSTDGVGTAASFASPIGAAFDPDGNIYITEYVGGNVRKIAPNGTVTTLATGIIEAFGVVYLNGDLYVNSARGTIYKVTLSGTKTVFAGGTAGNADGNGTAAKFNRPFGMAKDSAGNLYIADISNHNIRKIAPNGDVTTVAGNPGAGTSADGPLASATIYNPSGIAVGADDTIYFTEVTGNKIRKIANGAITTIAGGSTGTADGTGSAASFNFPYGMTMGNTGLLYVADFNTNIIRQVTTSGTVKTVAGTGTSGSTDGNGSTATFNRPIGLATDPNGVLIVTDWGGHLVRKISGQ